MEIAKYLSNIGRFTFEIQTRPLVDSDQLTTSYELTAVSWYLVVCFPRPVPGEQILSKRVCNSSHCPCGSHTNVLPLPGKKVEVLFLTVFKFCRYLHKQISDGL